MNRMLRRRCVAGKSRWLILATTLGVCCAGCAAPLWETWQPNPDIRPTIVRVDAHAEWTDSGLTVRAGELLFVTATGEARFAENRRRPVGPDGADPLAGVTVGRGGLIGRIDPSGESFDIGARTAFFKDPNIHSHRWHPPPPLSMPASGRLLLGFKSFTPGNNSGGFEVTITPAAPRSTARGRAHESVG